VDQARRLARDRFRDRRMRVSEQVDRDPADQVHVVLALVVG